MTFTERNMAPREPAGPVIPDGVRTSLLKWFTGRGIVPTHLWHRLVQHEGYGNYADVEKDLRTRFSEDEALAFGAAMASHFQRASQRIRFDLGVDYNAQPALKAIPAPLFLDVLEDAVSLMQANSYEAVTEINRIFGKRGIYYRFNPMGKAEWHGDEGAYGSVLRPALDALIDPRLQGARSEFETAMRHLRAGTVKDEEDAVEEAAKAVESVMKVLLQEHGAALTGKETARPLFELLSKNGIVVAETDSAVTATARLRNAHGGHGAGAVARQVPKGVATLAVQSACTAIGYLVWHPP